MALTSSVPSTQPVEGVPGVTDYYWVLNVPLNFDTSTLKVAYVRRCESISMLPDDIADLDQRNIALKGLAEAYAVLRDEKTRRIYDEARARGSVELSVDKSCNVCHGALKRGQYCPACGQNFVDFFNLVFHLYMESRIEAAKVTRSPVSYYIDASEAEFWDALERFPRDYQQRFGVALLPFAVDGEVLAELDGVGDAPGKNKFAFGASLGSLFDASFRLDGGLPDQLKRPKVAVNPGPSAVYPAPLPDKPARPYRDAAVSWGYKHGARKEILYFVLEMRDASDKTTLAYSVLYKGPETSTVVQGLRPGGSYLFRVAGVNGEGLGAFSMDTQFSVPTDLGPMDIKSVVAKHEEKKKSTSKPPVPLASSSMLVPSSSPSSSSSSYIPSSNPSLGHLSQLAASSASVSSSSSSSSSLALDGDGEDLSGKRRKRKTKTQKLEDELKAALTVRHVPRAQELLRMLSNGDYALSSPSLLREAAERVMAIEREVHATYLNVEAKLRVIKSLTSSLEKAHPDELERAVAEAEQIVMPNADDQTNLSALLKEARHVVKLIKSREALRTRIDEKIAHKEVEGLDELIEEAKVFGLNTTQARKTLKRLRAWRDALAQAEPFLLGARTLEPTLAPKIAEAIESCKSFVDLDAEMPPRIDRLQKLYAQALAAPIPKAKPTAVSASGPSLSMATLKAIHAQISEALSVACSDSQKVILAIVAASPDEATARTLGPEILKLNAKLDNLLSATPTSKVEVKGEEQVFKTVEKSVKKKLTGPTAAQTSASPSANTYTALSAEFPTASNPSSRSSPSSPMPAMSTPIAAAPSLLGQTSWSAVASVPVVNLSASHVAAVSPKATPASISKEYFPPLPGSKVAPSPSQPSPFSVPSPSLAPRLIAESSKAVTMAAAMASVPAPAKSTTSSTTTSSSTSSAVPSALAPVAAAAPSAPSSVSTPSLSVKKMDEAPAKTFAQSQQPKAQPSLAQRQTPKNTAPSKGLTKKTDSNPSNSSTPPTKPRDKEPVPPEPLTLSPLPPSSSPSPLPPSLTVTTSPSPLPSPLPLSSSPSSLAPEPSLLVPSPLVAQSHPMPMATMYSQPSPSYGFSFSAMSMAPFPALSSAMMAAAQWMAALALPPDVHSSLLFLDSTEAELNLVLDSSSASLESLRAEERTLLARREEQVNALAMAEDERQRQRKERLDEAERSFRETADFARAKRHNEVASQHSQALNNLQLAFTDKETRIFANNAQKRKRDLEEWERRVREEDALWARETDERRSRAEVEWKELKNSLDLSLKDTDQQIVANQESAWKTLLAEIVRKDADDQHGHSKRDTDWSKTLEVDLAEIHRKLETDRVVYEETKAKIDQLRALQITFRQIVQGASAAQPQMVASSAPLPSSANAPPSPSASASALQQAMSFPVPAVDSALLRELDDEPAPPTRLGQQQQQQLLPTLSPYAHSPYQTQALPSYYATSPPAVNSTYSSSYALFGHSNRPQPQSQPQQQPQPSSGGYGYGWGSFGQSPYAGLDSTWSTPQPSPAPTMAWGMGAAYGNMYSQPMPQQQQQLQQPNPMPLMTQQSLQPTQQAVSPVVGASYHPLFPSTTQSLFGGGGGGDSSAMLRFFSPPSPPK